MNVWANLDWWSAVLGFVGTIILFFFGLPPHNVNPTGEIALAIEQEDVEGKKRYHFYKMLSYIGLFLLILSFLCQMLKFI